MIRIHTGDVLTDFDAGYCRGSMVPVQDPVFPTIRRDRFTIDPESDLVTIPPAWIAEARDKRVPELRAAAAKRLPLLLGKVQQLVRPFDQRDFDYFFYLCPYFNGGTASAKVYPLFIYLRAAVGDLAFSDALFTDQYLFHEVLHNFVMERVDYTKGTPILNDLAAKLFVDQEFTAAWMKYAGLTGTEPTAQLQAIATEMVGLVLTHVHVYAIMTATLRAVGDEAQLQMIRSFETTSPASHPSYVKAWQIVKAFDDEPGAIERALAEVR